MDRRLALAIGRAGFALLVFVAIAVQIVASMNGGAFKPTRFFAYFTIISNVFGALVFLALAARWRSARTPLDDLLRGASVVYLTITFIVVILLLSGTELQLAIKWVDDVVHKVFPIAVVIDWLIDPPVSRLTVRHVALWFAYPLVWVVLTLIRGAYDNWYPYPFLDPANGGYGSVAIYFVAILVGFVVIAGIVLWIGNTLGARRSTVSPS